ncbi:RNA polymerase sigma factor [Ruminococcus sp. AF14-5]|nr:RNA polymerase sigma factor [Ruminococcus sp. AF14-5]
MSDRKLLKKVRDGDKEALSDIIKQYYADIFHFCLYMIQNEEDSYDITQETFLKFMKYGTSYQRNNLKGYLLTIARNCCFDYQQRKKETGKNLRSYEAENENGIPKISENTKNIQQYPDICGTDKMKELEDYLYLKGLLNRLSQEVREVIILRAYEELKFKDIAKMMNCSLSTAKSRYRIGIQQMKNMIKEGD